VRSLRLVSSTPATKVLHGVTSVNRRRVEYAWITPLRTRRRALTLVLLHESLDSLIAWKDFPRTLSRGTGCPVFAFSRPGCGQSDPALEQRRSDYLHVEAHAVLPALLAQHGIDKPLLVGHGDGASLALLHAASFGVAAIVAIAPYAFVEEQTLARIRVARAVYESSDWKKRLARLHRDPDATFRAWADTWIDPAFRDWNIAPQLASITAPIVLLQGEDDPFATLAQLTTIARAVRGPVSSIELEAVGHVPWSEAPDAVVTAVDDLVGRISQRADTRR
jgi:pimeloyl-ACP methyl ester carboxylesterase